ncbi:MAG: hypothetical protein AAFX39_13665 [Pseudomonadota bacterium]
MAKTIAVLLALATLVHMIRPLGLPGLRQRKDAWKIAIFGIAAMLGAVLLQA